MHRGRNTKICTEKKKISTDVTKVATNFSVDYVCIQMKRCSQSRSYYIVIRMKSKREILVSKFFILTFSQLVLHKNVATCYRRISILVFYLILCDIPDVLRHDWCYSFYYLNCVIYYIQVNIWGFILETAKLLESINIYRNVCMTTN